MNDCKEDKFCQNTFKDVIGKAKDFFARGMQYTKKWDNYIKNANKAVAAEEEEASAGEAAEGAEAAETAEAAEAADAAVAAESGSAVGTVLETIGCTTFPVVCGTAAAVVVAGAVTTQIMHFGMPSYVAEPENDIDDLDYNIGEAHKDEDLLVEDFKKDDAWMMKAVCSDQAHRKGEDDIGFGQVKKFVPIDTAAQGWYLAMQQVQSDAIKIRNVDKQNHKAWEDCNNGWFFKHTIGCGSEPKLTMPHDITILVSDMIQSFRTWQDQFKISKEAAKRCSNSDSSDLSHLPSLLNSFEHLLKEFYTYDRKWRRFEKAMCNQYQWTFCTGESPAAIFFGEVALVALNVAPQGSNLRS